MKRKHMLLTLLASTAVFAGSAQAQTAITSLPGVTDDSGVGTGPFRVTSAVTLTTGTDYLLDETIYVDGGLLTIQPGVIIAGAPEKSLVVTRGSQIDAEGTAADPIIFTSQAEYDHIQDSIINPAPEVGDNSQWGGVIILGNAPINFFQAVSPFDGMTVNVNQGENKIEGIVGGTDADFDGIGDLIEYGQDNFKNNAGEPFLTAGVPNPLDNSGTLKYVSIRYGGFALGLDNEVNGLTMGGVGSGTTIEYVEVFNNSDDGFEWFGGTVNCKYLVSAFNEDEDFDMDEGYSGKIQFAFSLRYDDVDGDGNVENGSELDGGNGSITTGSPQTTAQMWNATYLGAGRVGTVATKGNVFRMKDNFNGQFHNCVFDDFGGNLIRIDDSNTAARVTDGTLKINNSHWGRYNGTMVTGNPTIPNPDAPPATIPNPVYLPSVALANGTGNSSPTAQINPGLRGISRLPDGGLDPRPRNSSPLLSSTLSTPPAGLDVVNHRGAFGATNWALNWTKLDADSYFGDLSAGNPAPLAISELFGVTEVSPTGPWLIEGNVTLSSSNDYLLDQTIYVEDGGSLTIDAGTIIAGASGASLVVTRGAQIIAEGTAQNPIIFTSLQEYDHIADPVNNPAPEIGDNSQWGGLVVLGSAPINYYVATNPFTGDAGNTNRGENAIEGITGGTDADGDGIGDLIEYGQDNFKAPGDTNLTAGVPDPLDNSGIIKYVSIRFGGDILGLDNEVNGLTMGGVGSGTTIEYVEVLNNTDDGFEWFGGTVNCKYLVSAFNQDEDFDMDEGYSGKIQFAFAIREDDVDGSGAVENGSELDGGNGSITTGMPLTTAQMWNATYLGAGRVGAVANLGNVFRMKDNFAGQFHNCVFDDFGGNLIRLDDTNTAARVGTELLIQNSHWGRYNGSVATGQVAAATTLANGTGNTDPTAKTDPLLGGISRQPDGGLDPRPLPFSPLYSGTALSTPPMGLDTVNYRGAFGATNWALGWTYLDSENYFGDLNVNVIVDTDNDGIDDRLEGTPALAALGFTVGVNNVSNNGGILGSNLFSDFSTSSQLLEIGYFGSTIDTGTGDAILTLDLQGSTTLGAWSFEQDINVGLPSGTKFYRFADN